MKYSTYLMIGAFFAGLIITITIVVTILASGKPWSERSLTLKGDIVNIELPKFKYADIQIKSRSEKFILEKFRGIEIIESDTIQEPVMKLREGLNAMTQTVVINDTLKLTVDPGIVCDTLPDSRHAMFLTVDNIHPISIFVPKGMLKGFRNNSDAIYLSEISTTRINASVVNGRVVLDNCDIDSLVSNSRSISEIKLTNSKIRIAALENGPKKATVNCTDKTSLIETLKISTKKADQKCSLKLGKANIGKLEWNPADTTSKLDLQIVRPILITSPTEN